MSVAKDPTRPTSGLKRILLIASLALNVFLIAVAVGHFMHAPRRGDPVKMLKQALAEAPAEVRAKGEAFLRAAQEQVRGGRLAEVEAAQAALLSAMRAVPFDAAAMQAAQIRHRAAQAESRGALFDGMAKVFALLTPEQKAKIADRVEKRIRRRRNRWRRMVDASE